MKRWLCSVILLLGVLFIGYDTIKEPHYFPQKGELTAEGKLIIHVFIAVNGDPRPVILETAYGFMLFNDGDIEHPKPRFLLAMNKTKQILEFTSVEEFKQALQQLPKGTVLYLYDKCLVSTSYGLQKNVYEDIENFCKHIGISVEMGYITCTCW